MRRWDKLFLTCVVELQIVNCMLAVLSDSLLQSYSDEIHS